MPVYHHGTVRLYYEIHGTGAPLLFLHGLGSSTRDWEYQSSFFAKKFRVYLLDFRGHGKSSKPAGNYSLNLFTEDTLTFISEIIQEPVHIIGLSLGAMIACSVAAHPSSFIKSLTLVNCPARIDISSFRHRMHALVRLLLLHIFGMKAIGRFLAPQLFPKPEQKDLRKIFMQRWKENDKNAYIQTTQSILNWNIFPKAPFIKCPVHVIAAEHDYFPLQEKKAYIEKIANAKLRIITDTHHAVPVEAATVFNKVLLDMLQGKPDINEKI